MADRLIHNGTEVHAAGFAAASPKPGGVLNEGAARKLIERKREGEPLSARDWQRVIAAFVDGTMNDAQMAALCMACVWRGMDIEEIVAVTGAMVASGQTIAFALDRPIVDKHSSGGVADLVSLVAVPLVAACGVAVAKLSGRALGHTGGTIDKLESIPGFRVDLDIAAFKAQVARVGCAIVAQTADIVPADKKLYALRDRTGTVPSVGLIATSIVSKKLAGGADSFVFDVKTGRGAFMAQPDRAIELASMLVRVAAHFGKPASAIVSNMDEPLGTSIGTGLEVIEAREFLRGEYRDPRAERLCIAVCAEMLKTAGIEDGEVRAQAALRSGAAYEKFIEMVTAQGATREGVEAMHPRGSAERVVALDEGFLGRVDVVALGNIARLMSSADPFSGVRALKRIGEPLAAGEAVAEVFGGTDVEAAEVRHAFKVVKQKPPAAALIYETLRSTSAIK